MSPAKKVKKNQSGLTLQPSIDSDAVFALYVAGEQKLKKLAVFEVIALKSECGDRGICNVGSALCVNDQV